ncbi:sulfur carrier protein ThiS [Silvanigrella aquatica]|uniref:Thiamine biosynthesis protein ThiS n=1 Tax=Silvanigrella aquatica TaxID=1915309 RepID=A0A1L4D1B2_9BACT|nr:sulfur carrier protein ThiS [Silvanigrella aquatica]APJ03993.1 thiamine biosynthesis protein ThiS [Silvanigrella aquatica]
MDQLNIKINGIEKTYNRNNLTLENIIKIEGMNTQGSALAVNYVFIPKQNHKTFLLKNKDEIEIVIPFQGG